MKVDRSKGEFAFWKKRDKRLRPLVTSTCKRCGIEFEHQPSQRRLYCSYVCQDAEMGGCIEIRLERMVNKLDPHMCWEWRGSLNRLGYGTVSVDGKTKLAHRVAYRTWYGPIEKGMMLCHTCDNRKCCNPNHLYPGTHEDNMRDMAERGRSARPNSKTTVEERNARLRERIKKQVLEVDECWEWQGKFNESGYGVMSVEGRKRPVHRAAYIAFNGPIEKGMFICHTCDNTKCCNPGHLYQGTHADNMRDMSERNRAGSTKTTWEDRAEIMKAIKRGETANEVAARYNISPTTVRRWANNLKPERERRC